MNTTMYFVACALVLVLTILISFYLKYKIPTKDNSLLMAIIWIVAFSNLLDFMIGMDGRYYVLSNGMLFFLYCVSFLNNQVLMATFTVYVISCTATRQLFPSWKKVFFVFVNLIGVVMLLINCTWRWLFDVQEEAYRFVATPYMGVYHVFLAIFIFYCFVHLLRFGKVLDTAKKVSLFLFMIIVCLGVWFECAFKVRVYGFCVTIGLLWIYINVPKIERVLDVTTAALNENAFEKKLEASLQLELPMQVLALRFRGKSMIEEKYGKETYQRLLREIASFLGKKAGRENVYYLHKARFAVMIPKNATLAKEFANEILGEVQRTWRIQGDDISETMVGALLELPGDVKEIQDVYNYLKYLEIMPVLRDKTVYEGKHLDIAYMKRYDEIERAIDRALLQTSFEVYYQPIYSVTEEKVVAAEALLRMYDDEMGFVSPEEFIPIAEKNGKIVEIGHIVLEQVCQFLQKENVKEQGIQYIEVNLSAIECLSEKLPHDIREILDRYEIDSSQINLEITETALANNQTVLAENMSKINDLGVTFSLDDYGTGYSTISYIMKFPFHIVKIDKSILWTAFENERAMIALCASVNMIKDMGMKIVVEGVESEEMARELKMLGCDYLQGFYYSKPLPREEFLKYISETK